MQRLSSKETSCEVLVAYTGVGAEKGEMHKCRMQDILNMGQTGYYRRTDWIPDVKKKKKRKKSK